MAKRFFVNNLPLSVEQELTVSNLDLVRHFLSLRVKAQDFVYLFNGDSFDYRALVLSVNKKTVTLFIKDCKANNYVLPVTINLILSLVQKDSFELALQKSVELGVNSITPIYTDFSQRIDQSRLAARLLRWQQIIISACEQSNRNQLPSISYPLTIGSIVDNMVVDHANHKVCNIVCDCSGDKSLNSLNLNNYQAINLLIGPEGGFSKFELESLSSWYQVRLGRNILRAETACIVGLGCLLQKLDVF